LLTLGLVKAPLPLAYSKTAIVVSLAYTLMPFMVLTVASVLQNSTARWSRRRATSAPTRG